MSFDSFGHAHGDRSHVQGAPRDMSHRHYYLGWACSNLGGQPHLYGRVLKYGFTIFTTQITSGDGHNPPIIMELYPVRMYPVRARA